jgi:hypothetical protein
MENGSAELATAQREFKAQRLEIVVSINVHAKLGDEGVDSVELHQDMDIPMTVDKDDDDSCQKVTTPTTIEKSTDTDAQNQTTEALLAVDKGKAADEPFRKMVTLTIAEKGTATDEHRGKMVNSVIADRDLKVQGKAKDAASKALAKNLRRKETKKMTALNKAKGSTDTPLVAEGFSKCAVEDDAEQLHHDQDVVNAVSVENQACSDSQLVELINEVSQNYHNLE